jgi:hypothetical protein
MMASKTDGPGNGQIVGIEVERWRDLGVDWHEPPSVNEPLVAERPPTSPSKGRIVLVALAKFAGYVLPFAAILVYQQTRDWSETLDYLGILIFFVVVVPLLIWAGGVAVRGSVRGIASAISEGIEEGRQTADRKNRRT